MAYPHMTFPPLTPANVRNSKLFATREDMIRGLGIPRGGIIAEVGVALGDFSRFLIDALDPEKFVAIDTFTMHEWPEHWGRSSREIFGAASHYEFYVNRFQAYGSRVSIRSGLSHEMLAEFADRSFDMIYIDAAHDYESVRRDAAVATDKLKVDGFLAFNDYTMADPLLNVPYGVVPAVNEMVSVAGWCVVGFALQQHLFCDITLRRMSPDA